MAFGALLFGPPQKVSFAKGKSDAIAKLDGTFKLDKNKLRARKNAQARGAPPPPPLARARWAATRSRARCCCPAPCRATRPPKPHAPPPLALHQKPTDALVKRGADRRAGIAPAAAPGGHPHHLALPAGPGAGAPSGAAPPNRTLLVQGLPEAATQAMVTMLFQQYPGFKAVRMVEARPGIAFVDFEAEQQSGVALSGLQGFKIGAHAMSITFAKQ